MPTLDDYAAVLAKRERRMVPAGERITFAYDLLQHQGTPKRTAYEHMTELVALDMEQDVWELWGIIGAGAGRPGALDRVSPEARERLAPALYEASRRIFDRLKTTERDEEAVSLLAALAGVIRAPSLHDLLTRLDHGIERRCARCGAHVTLERRGANLERNGEPIANARPAGSTPSAVSERLVGPPAIILEAASLAVRAALVSVLTALFGAHPCRRCAHPIRLLEDDAPAETPSAKGTLRRKPEAGGAVTLAIPSAPHARFVARLLAIVTTNSPDMVRLAGLGELGAQRVLAWPSTSPTPPPTERTVMCDDPLPPR